MDLEKELKAIREHFAGLTIEKFEENLLKSGARVIESSCESEMHMITEQEMYLIGGKYGIPEDSDLNIFNGTYLVA